MEEKKKKPGRHLLSPTMSDSEIGGEPAINGLFGCHDILEILGSRNAKLELLGNLGESQYLACLDVSFFEIVIPATSLQSVRFKFYLRR